MNIYPWDQPSQHQHKHDRTQAINSDMAFKYHTTHFSTSWMRFDFYSSAALGGEGTLGVLLEDPPWFTPTSKGTFRVSKNSCDPSSDDSNDLWKEELEQRQFSFCIFGGPSHKFHILKVKPLAMECSELFSGKYIIRIIIWNLGRIGLIWFE